MHLLTHPNRPAALPCLVGRAGLLLTLALALPGPEIAAQTVPSPGPVVEGFGAVYDVPAATFPLDMGGNHWAVFDVALAAEDPGSRNRRLESAARYLNMHARAGVPGDRMKVALVVHGGAGKDLLTDEAYEERYGTPNPNLPMIEALAEAGVGIYLCGQTAAARNLPLDGLAEPVVVALSAMTALVALQNEGYRLIAF
jgi:intracellular sulfur oxidation DsrE/DsrF family protein